MRVSIHCTLLAVMRFVATDGFLMSVPRSHRVVCYGKEVMPGQSQGRISVEEAKERTGWPHWSRPSGELPAVQQEEQVSFMEAVATQEPVVAASSESTKSEEAVLTATMQCLESAFDAVETALSNSSPEASASLVKSMSRLALRLDATRRRLEEL